MAIQAVVFDWAGTTIDYGSRAPIIAFQRAFAHFGINVPEAVIRADVGLDKAEHIAKLFAQPDTWAAWVHSGHNEERDVAIQEVYQQFQTEIRAVLTETGQLKPGMQAFCAYLQLKHIAVASTSGYTAAMIDQLVPVAHAQGYQPVINVTSERTAGIGRPQADMLTYAIQHLQIDDPQTVIKVGDTVNDILEGKNAHTISVGVIVGSNLIGMSEAEFVALPESEQTRLKEAARETFIKAGADYTIDSMADLMPLIEALDQKALQVPLLLTPGPLTTSASVKQTMLVDHGTWDDEYKVLTQSIRRALLAVGHADPELYTSVLVQGSGSFGVEATLQTAVPDKGTLLIAMNGAYGQRMATMATRLGINHVDLDFGETQIVSAEKVLNVLHQHPEVTHFAMVHSETTTGILNPLTPLIPQLTEMGIVTIVDAMSSFGGVPIDVTQLGVDYLISSANKCIQGVPGFAFVLAKQLTLATTEGNARSLSLDLYDQWRCFEEEAGKWRFTSPTHTVYAFRQALNELIEEGGVAARHARYAANEKRLRQGMMALGFEPLLPTRVQSPIITSFKYPDARFDFRKFYEALKLAGFIIYPGKVSKAKTFRIGNIGEIYPDDIQHLLQVIAKTEVAQPVAVNE